MSARDTDRIPIKLKLVSGSYIFQSNQSKFNQSQIDATCLLCGEEDEDLEHFLLRRQLLETTRQETIYAIDNEVNTIINRRMHQMSNEENIQIILDCSFLLNNDITMKLEYRQWSVNKLTDLEFQCRRHLYNMHSARYRMMTLIRSRKR